MSNYVYVTLGVLVIIRALTATPQLFLQSSVRYLTIHVNLITPFNQFQDNWINDLTIAAPFVFSWNADENVGTPFEILLYVCVTLAESYDVRNKNVL